MSSDAEIRNLQRQVAATGEYSDWIRYLAALARLGDPDAAHQLRARKAFHAIIMAASQDISQDIAQPEQMGLGWHFFQDDLRIRDPYYLAAYAPPKFGYIIKEGETHFILPDRIRLDHHTIRDLRRGDIPRSRLSYGRGRGHPTGVVASNDPPYDRISYAITTPNVWDPYASEPSELQTSDAQNVNVSHYYYYWDGNSLLRVSSLTELAGILTAVSQEPEILDWVGQLPVLLVPWHALPRQTEYHENQILNSCRRYASRRGQTPSDEELRIYEERERDRLTPGWRLHRRYEAMSRELQIQEGLEPYSYSDYLATLGAQDEMPSNYGTVDYDYGPDDYDPDDPRY